MIPDPEQPFTLRAEGGRLLLMRPDAEPVAVRAVWARPLTDRDGAVGFLTAKDEEAGFVRSLDDLDEPSRAAARAALARRYLLLRILSVRQAAAHFGARVFEVETPHGVRRFALKDPNRNVVATPRGLVLSDVAGNRYEVSALDALDPASRRRLAAIL